MVSRYEKKQVKMTAILVSFNTSDQMYYDANPIEYEPENVFVIIDACKIVRYIGKYWCVAK